MSTLIFQAPLSTRYRVADFIIESLKVYLVIKPLQFLFRSRNKEMYRQLANCPENSIGKDLVKMLKLYNLEWIPYYESHDLKHLILNYGMSSEEEIRMQAYLFGNGNRSITCILFLLSGVLLPSAWNKFYHDYKKGKNAPSILDLKLQDCMNIPTARLREKYTAARS